VDCLISKDSDANTLRSKDRDFRPGMDPSDIPRGDRGRFKESVTGNDLAHEHGGSAL
jgi:hypothetical protein